MVAFAQLSGLVVNLDAIQFIKFDPDPPMAVIFLASGYEDFTLYGQDALLLMDYVDRYSIGDSTILFSRDERASPP